MTTCAPYPVYHQSEFEFIDSGFIHVSPGNSGDPAVVLLHGMLGDRSNWSHTVGALARHAYRVLVPSLPVYELPLNRTSVWGLVAYIYAFVQKLGLKRVVLVGNSLGGHVAVLYAVRYPQEVEALILSGASGICEVELGTSIPRRFDKEYIREKAAVTFYDPRHATDELVDQMYNIVTNRDRVVRLIRMARATRNESVLDYLPAIDIPTLLIWGREDRITPPGVSMTFAGHMPNARLHLIDRCGHAPMMEHPEQFNSLMLEFLNEIQGVSNLWMIRQ